MNKAIVSPSIELVQKYINEFNHDPELILSEDALSFLFTIYPTNQELRYVLIKVTLLDSLYNTNLRMGGKNAVVKVASHILSCKIDTKLQIGSPELINEIAVIDFGNKKRRDYSFVTKYCHWHQPNKYPIYDSRVENMLWKYRDQDNFMKFELLELQEYPRYKEIVDGFRKYYGLRQFNYKEIDKFLWKYADDLLKEL